EPGRGVPLRRALDPDRDPLRRRRAPRDGARRASPEALREGVRRLPLGEVLVAAELVRLPVQPQLEPLSLLDAADRREPARLRDGREELEVLAEAQVVER